MKDKKAKRQIIEQNKTAALSLRLDDLTNARLERLAEASRRSKSSFVVEALEKMLPEFEKNQPALVAA